MVISLVPKPKPIIQKLQLLVAEVSSLPYSKLSLNYELRTIPISKDITPRLIHK